jgi:predicted nucleic acid-binding Zn ribbon protein
MVDAQKIKDKASKKSSSTYRTGGSVADHRHCRICNAVVSLKADPRVCKDEECLAKQGKNERNERLMRIMMFVFLGLFALPLLLKIFGV